MSDRFARNIRALYLLQGLSYIAPLAVIPYLTRTLGAEAFGRYAVALAVAQYLGIVTDYGFNLTATRDVARSLTQNLEVSRIFWSVQAAKSLLALIAAMLLCTPLVIANSTLPIDPALILAAAVALPGSVAFPVWLFQGLQQMGVIVWSTAAARVILMLLTFALVRTPDDAAIAVALSAGGPLVAGSLCLTIIWHKQIVGWHKPTMRDVRSELRGGWPIFLSTSAISIYVASAIPVLRAFTDDASVGIYAAADRIVRAAHSLLTPLAQAFFPHVNTIYSKSPERALASLRRHARVVLVLGGAMSVALLLGADLMTTLAFGAQYAESATVLRWLAPLPVVVGLSNVFGVQAMLTMGYRKTFTSILLLAALIYSVLIVPLALAWKVEGVAATVLITEAFVTLLMWIALRRQGVYLFLGRGR